MSAGNNQMTFLARNAGFTVKNPRKAWRTRKAMNAYRKGHPTCEYCGRSPIHVHHVKPVAQRPDLAHVQQNFISLCAKRCHLTLGHAGNWKHWVRNSRELCIRANIATKSGEAGEA